MTREDGTTYWIHFDKPYHSHHLLKKIATMPKKTPVSFEIGYQIVGEHIEAIFEEEDGGNKLAVWLNANGYFPEGLTTLGFHIELTAGDFEIVE